MTSSKKYLSRNKKTIKKINKSKKRSFKNKLQKKKGGRISRFLDKLIGVAEKNTNDDLTNTPINQQCYQKKFSNIQHCINQECVKKQVGDISLQSDDETKIKELEKENKILKNEISKLTNMYSGLDLHDYLFGDCPKKDT